MAVFHLDISREDIRYSTIAILPGSPERVPKIASRFKDPKILSFNREFHSALGYIDDTPVTICSTGIGGPSTSIVVEELAQLGIRTFLRVGTTGALQSHINVGDLIITQASVRLDGASLHFAPLNFPAASDYACTTALVRSAQQLKLSHHIGITASSDTFYPGQERYNTYSGRVVSHLRGSKEEWYNLGVLNYEMESATLFTQCATQSLRAGCVTAAIVQRNQQEIPNAEIIEKAENDAIDCVVGATKYLV